MVFHGDYLMPFLEENMKDEWDATFMIQDVGMATRLGGNAVAATKDADDPEMAAKFLQFLADEKNMREFCEIAQFVPVREAMLGQELDYKLQSRRP